MPVGIRFGIIEPRSDTAFPLSPDQFMRTDSLSGGASQSFLGIWRDRINLAFVRRWVGPEASSHDVVVLDRMLGSLQVLGASRWMKTEASTPRLRVRITHPEDWSATRFSGVTVIDAPQPILMVTTPTVREGYSFCLGGPYGEFTTIGRSGLVVAVSDATGSYATPDFGPRPATFRPSEATYDDTVTCSGQVRRFSFQFQEAGRPIVVNVLVSTSFLREEPRTLRYILDSIRISKR
jgi:hypothetical protein